MGGRKKADKSERRNNYPAAKPSDLDQFGQAMDKLQTDADKDSEKDPCR